MLDVAHGIWILYSSILGGPDDQWNRFHQVHPSLHIGGSNMSSPKCVRSVSWPPYANCYSSPIPVLVAMRVCLILHLKAPLQVSMAPEWRIALFCPTGFHFPTGARFLARVGSYRNYSWCFLGFSGRFCPRLFFLGYLYGWVGLHRRWVCVVLSSPVLCPWVRLELSFLGRHVRYPMERVSLLR